RHTRFSRDWSSDVCSSDLLADLGSPAAKVTTRLRGYRPGRRAVMSVRGEREGIYVKVLRPERIQRLHQRHELLAAVLPVPASLRSDERRVGPGCCTRGPA